MSIDVQLSLLERERNTNTIQINALQCFYCLLAHALCKKLLYQSKQNDQEKVLTKIAIITIIKNLFPLALALGTWRHHSCFKHVNGMWI